MDAILLAAGKGTRMNSELPKVLLEVAGRPMLHWVVDACREAGVRRCILVVGFKADLVRDSLKGDDFCAFVDQPEQLGTGHATRMAQPLFDHVLPVDVFVLAGDGPLIRPATLRRLLDCHRSTKAVSTLATAVIDDPAGYGRVLRAADGSFDRIVEQKDATDAQKQIREVNPSYYCFRSDRLFAGLAEIRADNSQKEYYLTDVPGLLKRKGQTVSVVDAVPPEDVLSINTPQQLAEVDRILRARSTGCRAASDRTLP
ncbi:MAG: NTP transferase domain-containing protein [Phycisphaeraceae bacterium]|nr:NTP transferase domain-containing protein [Phycisphaeraceae bacterium]